MSSKNWQDEIVKRLKSQVKKTDQESLLVLLHEKPDRDKKEDALLAVLVKAERAKERAKAAERVAENLVGARKTEERKARNHRLIQLGLLVDMAGLGKRSRGEILGGMLALGSSKPEAWASWKQFGDELLAEKEKEKAEKNAQEDAS